ncbi:MAG: hypothetical protein ACHQDC_05545 [Acidimicrobiales bacterium]
MESNHVRPVDGEARRRLSAQGARLFAVLVAGLIGLAFVAAACGDEDDSGADDTTTTTTTTAKAEEDFAPGTGLVTTSDGLDASLTVHECTSDGETDIRFEAVSPDGGKLVVIADGNQKSVTWRAPSEEREGTVETIQVGDTGNFTLSGKLTTADDSAAPATFELVGTCPPAGATTSTTM